MLNYKFYKLAVRDVKNDTSVVFFASFLLSHRPYRCSLPSEAMTRTEFGPSDVEDVETASFTQDEFLVNSFGGKKSWREFTTPGAGKEPTGEKDLSLESSFHRRIEPSYEPG